MDVFVYDFYPFVLIRYLMDPHSWIKIIYKSTHDITSLYMVLQPDGTAMSIMGPSQKREGSLEKTDDL